MSKIDNQIVAEFQQEQRIVSPAPASRGLPTLRWKRLSSNAHQPTRGTSRAIGLDLYADIIGDTATPMTPPDWAGLVIAPGRRLVVSTGIAVAVPAGYYGRVAPRSGTAVKNGVDVLAGVVDEDYRGPLKVVLLNTGAEDFWVRHHHRIAQLILERADILPHEEVDDLDATGRGAAGFGSTGR